MILIKKLSLAIVSLLFMSNVASVNEKQDEILVEVIVFHGVKQCLTCEAIKANSKMVVDSLSKVMNENQRVIHKIIDISKDENKAIAEKYEIAWTSLLLIKHSPDGKELVNNISKFAIKNARTNSENFKKQLEENIITILK